MRVDGRWAFVDVRVFDGTALLEDQTVFVEGALIAWVGDAGAAPPLDDWAQVTGSGRTLLPGFIDAHVHLGLRDPRTVLAGGVTSARDLGWAPEEIFVLAMELRTNVVAGPLVLAAGPMLTARRGYPTRAGWGPAATGLEVESEEAARHAVRSLADRGACVIKVAQEPRGGPTLPDSILRAIVNEAHLAGLGVASHVGSLAELARAVAGGVDELAHGLWSEEVIPDQLLHRMVDAGVVVTPTLHIAPTRTRLANLGRFVAAGGRVIYGTDMGNFGIPPSIDPEELRLMEVAGIPRLAVLAAATSLAADHLGLGGRGRIVGGAIADLVLVQGELPDALARPVLVMREGRRAR
ncbi:MAG: amidohydrolase family protein [Actinomycetota bacterium]